MFNDDGGIHESFKRMIQLVRNGAQMTREESQIVIRNFNREANFFVENAVKDSKNAGNFGFALECLGLHRLTEFKEEIISICSSNFMRQHAVETRNEFSREEILATARFIAELLFQGFMLRSTVETMIGLIRYAKNPSQESIGCRNLLQLAVMSKIMHEESKIHLNVENYKL